MPWRVAVCQAPDIRMNIEGAMQWVEKFTNEAESGGASVVCFPECFLQGYLTENYLAKKYAINLTSATFGTILHQLEKYRPVVVVGLIEEDEGDLFNTAVVIEKGKMIGKYRKIHLLKGEKIFRPGTEYPVFCVNGLKFGINICYDTQFADGAAAIAAKGAVLLLCPANNMMRYEVAEEYKNLHHQMRIERVNETGLWLMSADVVGEREGRVSYGPTSAIDPKGRIVKQVPLQETGMIIIEIL